MWQASEKAIGSGRTEGNVGGKSEFFRILHSAASEKEKEGRKAQQTSPSTVPNLPICSPIGSRNSSGTKIATTASCDSQEIARSSSGEGVDCSLPLEKIPLPAIGLLGSPPR